MWPELKFPPINLWSVWPMQPKDIVETKNYREFQHTECEFFPCHGDIDQNCLFCYCPLAWLECPGDYRIIESPKDIFRKDCSECTITHDSEHGWEIVQAVLEYPTLWNGK